jgi:serine/threonine-protein kinase
LARDAETGERVALKLLSEELAHGVGMERFAREGRVMMHLRHPHILPVLDSGSSGHRRYYVMP